MPSSQSPVRRTSPRSIDWKVAKDGVDVRRCAELRVVHAGLQPDPRPPQQVRHEVADHARPRPRRRDRAMKTADAGHLGRGRQADRWRPPASRARATGLASPGWPGGARAGGTSSSRRGSSGSSLFTALPMIATLAFTFTNINLAQAEPLQFVGLKNYETLLKRPAGLGLARRHASSSPLLALPVAVILPFLRRADAPLAAPARRRACSGSCSSCPTSCRSWPACSSGTACSIPTRAGSTALLEAIGDRAPAGLARGPGWIYPGLVIIGRLGHRGRDDRLPGRPQGHPDRPLRGGQDRRRRLRGRRSATSRSR